jgi:hypothetical protein
MLEMDQDSLAELRQLQARAYGPASDIAGDPEAVERLEALQAQAASVGVATPERRTGTGDSEWNEWTDWVDDDEAPDSLGPVADLDPDVDLEDDESDATTESPASPRRNRLRKWMPWLWVASLVVVGALAAGWTFASTLLVFTPIDRDADTRQLAVLDVDEALVPPGFFGISGGELTGFHEFHGLTPMVSTGEIFGGPADQRCLWLMRTDDVDPDSLGVSGPLFNDCAAGEFPATIEMEVTEDLPQELRDAFPDGTGLQFVLDGSRVGVFTDLD